MDKIAKAILKFTDKEKAIAGVIIRRLVNGNTSGLDIKKLKGYADIFRVRKGKLRILYRMNGDVVVILKIGYRKEATYRE